MNISKFIKMIFIGAMLLILSSCGNDNPTVDCLTCNDVPEVIEPTEPVPEPEPEPEPIEPEPVVPEVNLKDCIYVLLGDNPTAVAYDGNYTDAGLDQVVNGAGEDITLDMIINDAEDVNTSTSGEYIVEYSSDLCENNTTRVVIVEEEPVVEQGEWKILPF